MKTQRQFIIDTLIGYKNDPSTCGTDGINGDCLYLTPEGRKCAVGQHMKKGVWQEYEGGILTLEKKFGLKKMLKKKAYEQNLPLSVWEYMQSYHDAVANNSIDSSYIEEIESELGIELNELK